MRSLGAGVSTDWDVTLLTHILLFQPGYCKGSSPRLPHCCLKPILAVSLPCCVTLPVQRISRFSRQLLNSRVPPPPLASYTTKVWSWGQVTAQDRQFVFEGDNTVDEESNLLLFLATASAPCTLHARFSSGPILHPSKLYMLWRCTPALNLPSTHRATKGSSLAQPPTFLIRGKLLMSRRCLQYRDGGFSFFWRGPETEIDFQPIHGYRR